MISPSAKFGFHLAGLWLIIGCLAVITSITLLSTFVRSDCQAVPRLNVTAVADSAGNSSCSSAERISNFALSNTAYLQSIHTVTIQVVVAASLLVLQPVLRALIWSSLETEETSRVPSLESLQCRIQLSTSPGLMPGIADALTSRFLTSTTAFVIFLGILSLVTPIVVSPIYRMRKGVLYGAQINIVMEGGVGLSVTPVYVPNANAAVGVVAGRALVNSATINRAKLDTFSYSSAVTPFLDLNQIPKIAHATMDAVAVYQSLDCGPSAPGRFVPSNSSGQLVDISDSYWDTNVVLGILSSGGNVIGELLNDPYISTFYINATNATEPGWMNATASVVLVAANGTIEGAQQHIAAPQGVETRIKNVDVLACTSTTSLGLSTCEVSNGYVSLCTPMATEALPSKARNSSTGGIEMFIGNPVSVSTVLCTSPVTAYFSSYNCLPMYNSIPPNFISGVLAPLSYLTLNTLQDYYTIPFSYVQDALFFETRVGLAQGIVASAASGPTTITADLKVVFATSTPQLQVALFVVALGGAIIVTIAALRSNPRKAAELDVARLLAISRDTELDDVFAPFSDRSVSIFNEVQDIKVRYGYVERIKRHTLGLRRTGEFESVKGMEEATEHEDHVLNSLNQERQRSALYHSNAIDSVEW